MITREVAVNRQYSLLVGVADSTEYGAKRASYLAAARLRPQKTDAYIRLLNAYEASGVFDLEESAEFTAIYNGADELWDEDGGGDLCYLAGRMYMGMYTEEGAQVSMSARVQKAFSYLQHCSENPPEDETEQAVASCYFDICRFYKDYILASSTKKELTETAVSELLESAEAAMTAIEKGGEFDKLNLCGAICNLLYDQRSELARVAPGQGSIVLDAFDRAVEMVETAQVSREESTSLREAILSNQEEFRAAISFVFEQ